MKNKSFKTFDEKVELSDNFDFVRNKEDILSRELQANMLRLR